MDTALGKRIAQLRRQKGLKQEALAQALEVSPQAVSKWENDISCPDISLLPPLAQLLDVSVDELLSGKPLPAVQVVSPELRKPLQELMLRIVVDSADGDRVRVNLPMALVSAAMDLGLELPQVNGNKALNDIDLQKILALVEQGAIGNLVEVESSDGDTVRIFVE